VADDVDLSQVEWKRGNYDLTQLDALCTGNDARAAKVIAELRDKVTSTSDMQALGFCVSVQHAHYMAEVFNRAGIAAMAVSGETPEAERAAALRKLRDRELNCLFAVDLFNEGLDLPEIDTILLLRPTQSATVFIQQLGRGLRRAKDKSVLTVLDYIGQQRREFRFDAKLKALTGLRCKALEKSVEDGFAYLPSGSQIILDRVAQQTVLNNIREQLRVNRKQLVVEVRSYGEHLLEDYLRESGRSLPDVYRKTGTPGPRSSGKPGWRTSAMRTTSCRPPS
jgi:superfamily II DNA or RNA helicase